MNAGTCWGKNTIDPSGRHVEKPRKATLTLFLDSATVLVTMAFVEHTFNLIYIKKFGGGNFYGFISIFCSEGSSSLGCCTLSTGKS
jgi:hypothetical protein